MFFLVFFFVPASLLLGLVLAAILAIAARKHGPGKAELSMWAAVLPVGSLIWIATVSIVVIGLAEAFLHVPSPEPRPILAAIWLIIAFGPVTKVWWMFGKEVIRYFQRPQAAGNSN